MQETGRTKLPEEKTTTSVVVSIDGANLEGNLFIPPEVKGLVIFAHGSGSSRFSPRNAFVANVLNKSDVGTLLIDLLTPSEEQIDEQTAELRFNIPFLAERLVRICNWTETQPLLQGLKLGYFGASTGGAAALMATALRPDRIAAIVSRGGRPDLARDYLPRVKVPALLIVGERDPEVLLWNQQALKKLNAASRLEIVPKATHLFEETGALEAVATLAAEWFDKYFQSGQGRRPT